jgi:hypothetical protein
VLKEDSLQSIFLISHCAMSVIFIPIPPLIAPCQSSFSNLSPHLFFWLFFFLILSLLFFQPFPSFFSSSSPHYSTSYHYNSSNSSSPFLTLHLPIFFSISPYCYSSSNSLPPFLALLLSIIPHIIVPIPPTIHLPIFFFFCYKFTI